VGDASPIPPRSATGIQYSVVPPVDLPWYCVRGISIHYLVMIDSELEIIDQRAEVFGWRHSLPCVTVRHTRAPPVTPSCKPSPAAAALSRTLISSISCKPRVSSLFHEVLNRVRWELRRVIISAGISSSTSLSAFYICTRCFKNSRQSSIITPRDHLPSFDRYDVRRRQSVTSLCRQLQQPILASVIVRWRFFSPFRRYPGHRCDDVKPIY